MVSLGRMRELILESVNLQVPRGQVSIPRHQMPQIEKKYYPEYFDLLNLRGVEVTRMNIPADRLRAAQEEIDSEKVLKWSKSMPKGALEKPCIVSKDFYVLDGNHTWLAQLHQNSRSKIDCYQVDLGIHDLINITKLFDKVTNKTVKEEFKGENNVVF